MRMPRAKSKPEEWGWGPLTAFLSLFWVAAGIFESAWYGTMVSLRGISPHWGTSFLIGQGFWGLAGFFTPILVCVDRSLSLEQGKRLRSIALHIPALLCFGVTHTILRDQWTRLIAGKGIPPGEFVKMVPKLVASQLGGPLMIYVGVLAAVHGWSYYLRYRERARAAAALELDRAELRASLSEARLEALQAQLQPHFLFNALHAISTLILDDDKKGANEMISHLSRFLRMTLDNVESPTVPLSVELQFLDAYLRIQKVRFGERLRVSMEIEESARSAGVPSLVLQPLVENSIHHGIGSKTGAGRIVVRASVGDHRLRLEVEDDGPGFPDGTASGKGHGLSNIRERLEQLYPGEHDFGLSTVPAGGTLAAITIPFRQAAPESTAYAD
jgi:two-component system, LytTR family, sensor kinase